MSDRDVGRDSPKFMLRFPDGMRERISEAARINGRSMNAEIISRLEASFAPTPAINLDTGNHILEVMLSGIRHALEVDPHSPAAQSAIEMINSAARMAKREGEPSLLSHAKPVAGKGRGST